MYSELNRRLSARDWLIIVCAVMLGAGAYQLASALTYRIGFPLDDSWIHTTYARNLALYGQWAFQPGHLSAGSTAPLWTLLLTPGFWLHLEPLWWAYILGSMFLVGLSALAESTVRQLMPTYRPALPWVALFFAGEWHMLWAAESGMETLLQAFLATAVLALLMTGSRRYLSLGLLTGLSVWVRPDGLTLAAPAMLTILLVEDVAASRFRALVSYLIGFGSLLLPYLFMNLWLSGAPFPNTFYAKQTEYAVWQARPVLYRVSVLVVQLSTGPAIILLPSLVSYVILIVRQRRRATVVALLWSVSYLALYVSRLPPYQHGRYLMPAMPILFIFGLLGYLEFQRSNFLGRYQWALRTAWQWAIVLLTASFVVLGARAYAQDVGLIESEMVNTAKWVAGNIPPDAIVAAHDIGALGYWDTHKLIDLAGLASPEVLPFMRDEIKLAEFLNERRARYLIAFPGFYPALTRVSKPVFSSGGAFAPALGEQNMTVYCWSCP